MTKGAVSRRLLLTRGAVTAAGGLTILSAGAAAAASAPSKNIALFLDFCRAGQDRDLDKQMSFFEEDSVYHNMPDAPVSGRAGIRKLLSSYITMTDVSEILVHNIAETPAGIVLNERIDRFQVKGKWIECPVMNATEFRSGKIKVWRDYYDNAYLGKQMA